MSLYFASFTGAFLFSLFAVIRMLRLRIQQSMPFLVLFLAFQVVQFGIPLVVSRSEHSRTYQMVYEISEPLNWVMYLLIIGELYSLVFAAFPGIVTVMRKAAFASAVVAFGLSLVIAQSSPQTPALTQFFGYIERWERLMSFALATFILVMVYALSRYPIKLAYNVALTLIILTAYFACSFVVLGLGAASRLGVQTQTKAILLLNLACFLAWGVFVRRQDASAQIRLRTPSEPLEEERLLQQLTSINNMLVKFARH